MLKNKGIVKEFRLKTKEEKVLTKMVMFLGEKYGLDYKITSLPTGNFVYLHDDVVGMLVTITKVKKYRCIKIEQLEVIEMLRGKGIGTSIINDLKEIADFENVKLGLWCEKNNKKLFNFYSRLGFKYITTVDDDWLEYN